MSTLRLPYRLRQVLSYASSDHEAPSLPANAKNRLTAPMEHQFRILEPAEQQHLLRVYEWLQAADADDDTITAGLIHDVGKACAKCRITVIDRGLHVLLSRFAGPLYRRFAAMETAPALVRGLNRLANHAERGALAAEQAGYNKRVQYLVRHHESGGDSADVELKLLRQADNQAERA